MKLKLSGPLLGVVRFLSLLVLGFLLRKLGLQISDWQFWVVVLLVVVLWSPTYKE